jgi:hypothetical protein
LSWRRRLAAGLTATALSVLVGVAAAPSAHALPLLPDCKQPPAPEVPGRGVVGFFESPPKTLPPPGDPFAPKSTTSIYEQYGYAGLRWNTYDLGCGPDFARSPDAWAGTSVANYVFTLPKSLVAATGAVLGAAFHPDFLSVFDPLVATVVDSLRRTVFEQWFLLSVSAVGLLLIWRSRRASLASSAGAIGWALLVMVLATVIFRWPLVAGHAADQTVTTTLGAVTGGLNGRPNGSAGQETVANMHEALLYQAWLGGTFGNADAEVAKRYGPALFDAQAMTWREAEILRTDPAAGQRIIEAKEQKFVDTAAKVKDADPDAYEYLVGRRSDTRMGYAILAAFATLCAVPFLLVAGLLVLGALIIVRLGVMLFPAIAVLGLFQPMRSLVIGMGNTVAAAMINAVVFGIGTAVMVKGMGVILSPTTGLAGWMIVLLLLLLTIVMWVALRPFRRLTLMVSSRHNVFADGAAAPAAFGRGIARVGGRVATIAAGSFLGATAASKAIAPGAHTDDAGDAAPPQRAEATTVAVAPDAVSVEAAASAPVFVGAKGPVTVTAAHSGSFDDDPAQAAQALKASGGGERAPTGTAIPRAGAEGVRHESARPIGGPPSGGPGAAGTGQNGGGNGFSRDLDSMPARLEELVRHNGTDARNDNGNGHAGGEAQRAAPMDDVEGTPAEVVYRPQSTEAAPPEGMLNGRRR